MRRPLFLFTLIVLSACSLAAAQSKTRLRSGGGGAILLGVLGLSDFTAIGAFEPPNPTGDDIDFGTGLALRRVSGTPYLYMTGYAGKLVEFAIPVDGDIETGPPYTTASVIGQYGDIFGTKGYQSVVSDGGAGGPKEGLAGGWRPNGLYWDETDSRMYWTALVPYDNDAYPIASDNALGYSTMNFGAKTGAGVATWKLSVRANGAVTDAMTDNGNRWVNGVTAIPSGFVTSYLSSKRLGIGCGDPGISIASNGPISMGPALFALNPADLDVAEDRNYFDGTLHKLIFHPFKTAISAPLRKLRPADLPVNVSQGSADPNFDASTLYTSWADRIGGCHWIRGTAKEGLVVPAIGPTGTMTSTISASPTPTNTVFTVGSVGDTAVGDRVFFETVETKDQSNYDCSHGLVTGISAQQLTVNTVTNCETGVTDMTIAFAGGYAFAGTKYVGGGNKSTRIQSFLYIYSAAQLALSAQGSITASAIAPTAEGVKSFGGMTWPIRAQDTIRITGVAYDAVTCRLYVGLKDIPTYGALVSVFSVAAGC